MKKWLGYALALAAVPLLSLGGFGGRDVGKLQPVQVVLLETVGGKLQLHTDAGTFGRGEDLAKALEDLHKTAEGWVDLDTAEYLLLGEGTEGWLSELQEDLRPSCCLCAVAGQIDLTKVGVFLQQHPPKQTLARYRTGEQKLPRLISEEGRLKLVEE